MSLSKQHAPSPPPSLARQPVRVASPSTSSLNNAAIGSQAPRRAPVPHRAASTSLLQSRSYFDDDDDDDDSWWRNVVREQIDVQTLRDMARFFRTTEPPSLRSASIETERNCFGGAMGSDRTRWSLQSSLRRHRRSYRTSDASQSTLELRLPSSAVRSTTTSGFNYITILTPVPGDQRSNSHNTPKLISSSRSSSPTTLKTGKPFPKRIDSLRPNGTPTSPIAGTFQEQHLSSLKNKLNVEESDRGSASTNSNDRTSHSDRDSSLRLYGKMLHMLDASPVEGGEDVTPVTVGEEQSKDVSLPESKVLQSPTIVEQHSPSASAPTSLRSMSTYSTIPRPSSSKSGLGIQSVSHSGTGSSANTASNSSHRRQTSSNPSQTTKPLLPRVSSPHSPRQKQIRSPPSSRRPSNIVVNPGSLLQTPQQTANIMPESPGFPNLLASLTFPSPPEASPPHPASANTLSSPTSLLLQSPLSENGTRTDSAGPTTNADLDKHTRKNSDNAVADTSRQSSVSTATDTDHSSESTALDSRNSMGSITTVSSPIAKTCTADQDAYASVISSSKTQPQWPLVPDGTIAQQPDEFRKTSSSRLSQLSQISSTSASSTSTATTSATKSVLAERRRERREKVREKIRKDLGVSVAKSSNYKMPDGISDVSQGVDSPVLGYFPRNGTSRNETSISPTSEAKPTNKKATVYRPSPLASNPVELYSHVKDEATKVTKVDEQTKDLFVDALEIPIEEQEMQDNQRLKGIPAHHAETLEEVDEELLEKLIPTAPTLCMSAIMVTASIEPTPSVLPDDQINAYRPSTPDSQLHSSGENFGHLHDETRTISRRKSIPIKISQSLAAKLAKSLTEDNRERTIVERRSDPTSLNTNSVLSGISVGSMSQRRSLPAGPISPALSDVLEQSSPEQGDSRLHTTQHDGLRWLRNHQRQSVQDWRQAALRERERVERLISQKSDAQRRRTSLVSSGSIRRSGGSARTARTTSGSSVVLGSRANSIGLDDDSSNYRRASSLNDWQSNCPRWSVSSNKSESTYKVAPSIEQRFQRLERGIHEWNIMVVPLLENINRLLSEICQDSMTEEQAVVLRNTMQALGAMDSTIGIDAD